ncbi:hypothetical protein C0J52_16513 [Blattella germanica]|nr:hypothetical protein C0J52_16513 [Blattella germanica]
MSSSWLLRGRNCPGSRWQSTADLTVTVLRGGEPVRKRGRPRKKHISALPTKATESIPVPSSHKTAVTIIEEYIPSYLTSQQASILNAVSANLDQQPYGMMGPPALDMFGTCQNVHIKRRFVTPEQKQRQLELARARKKRFRERLKEKALLQKKNS